MTDIELLLSLRQNGWSIFFDCLTIPLKPQTIFECISFKTPDKDNKTFLVSSMNIQTPCIWSQRDELTCDRTALPWRRGKKKKRKEESLT